MMKNKGITVLLASVLFSAPLFAQDGEMKIQIDIGDSKGHITATLADNPTAHDFYKILPLTLKLENYAGAEKIGRFDTRLSTAGAPRSYAGKKGDLTYYAPWGNIAIFTENSTVGDAGGLIYFGKFEQGLERLRQLPDNAEITIRPMKTQ